MPTGKRKFVRLSLRNIARRVRNISHSTVGRWLRRRKFSLRSNGCRVWMWKKQLQQFADETGLKITVRHYPRGASKWNPVEHRLFCPISKNWSGHPLRSMATLLGFIRGTTTQRGLKVKARWNRRKYNTKEKVSKEEQKSLNFKRHKVIPLWNYTVFPKPKTQ